MRAAPVAPPPASLACQTSRKPGLLWTAPLPELDVSSGVKLALLVKLTLVSSASMQPGPAAVGDARVHCLDNSSGCAL